MTKIENFICQECMKCLSSKKKLNRHIKEIHSEEFIPIKCPGCNKIFKRKEAMTRHYAACHLNLKFNCRLCCSRFIEKCRLSKRYNKIHGLPFCPKCEYLFIDILDKGVNISDVASKKLVSTIIPNHECISPIFICQYKNCGQKYKRRHYLNLHMNKVHNQKINEIVPPIKQSNNNEQQISSKSAFINNVYTKFKKKISKGKKTSEAYFCEYKNCFQVFKTKILLKTHIVCKHGIKM